MNDLSKSKIMHIGVMFTADVEPMSFDFATFVTLMMEKLNKNGHKKTPTEHDTWRMLAFMIKEISEFIQQVERDEFDPNCERELADIANFAFLLFVALQRKKVAKANEIEKLYYNECGPDVSGGSALDDHSDPTEAERS